MRNTLCSLVTALCLALPAVAFADTTGQAPKDAAAAPKASAQTSLDGKININDATAQQWELLPGIGPSMAKKLVDYRAKQKFGDTTHVMRIKGIGRKTYDAIKPYLTLEGPTTLQKVRN